MFEGKEVDGKVGDVGNYFVDFDDAGMLKLGVELDMKKIVIDGGKKLLTKTKVGEKIVGFISGLLAGKAAAQGSEDQVVAQEEEQVGGNPQQLA